MEQRHPSDESFALRVSATLRHYRKELGRGPGRTLDWVGRRLPLRVRDRTLLSLNRVGRPVPFNLDGVNPLEEQHLVERRVVADAAETIIVSTAPEAPRSGHYWPAVRLHRLRDCVVEPRSGLVFASSRLVCESGDGLRDPQDVALLASALQRSTRGRAILEGTLVPICGTAFNYYHFLIEVLPRVLLAREHDPQARALLGPDPSTHILRAFDALGIPYVSTDEPAIHSDDVLLCDPVPFGWPHPRHLRLLADLDVPLQAGPVHGLPRRIYVSRSGSARAMSDESVLEDWMRAQGFAVVHLETMDWPTQVWHFRAADTVVGAHGAGLANCTFMKPGAEVFELTTGIWWHPCFRNLAHRVHLRHHLLRLAYAPRYEHGHASDAIEVLQGAGLCRVHD